MAEYLILKQAGLDVVGAMTDYIERAQQLRDSSAEHLTMDKVHRLLEWMEAMTEKKNAGWGGAKILMNFVAGAGYYEPEIEGDGLKSTMDRVSTALTSLRKDFNHEELRLPVEIKSIGTRNRERATVYQLKFTE